MADYDRPSTLISFGDVFEEINRKRTIELEYFSQLPKDAIDYGGSFLQAHCNDSMSTFINETTHREHVIRVNTSNYINFLFTFKGSNLISLKDRLAHSRNIDVIILINTNIYSITQRQKEIKKAVSFMVYPEVLVEQYGLKFDTLPGHLKAALKGVDVRPTMLKLSLQPRARISLGNIFETDIAGMLFRKYVFAKIEELMCEAVHALNNAFSPKTALSAMSSDDRLLQSIEAAAYLYRQNIGDRLSVAELCRRVGLNRNRLNDGFKDVFGVSPGEYARVQALDWARSQLIEGGHSIKEISDALGYSNVSAFSRAYGAHFGAAPTKSVGALARVARSDD